jgi:hypothetical protein
MDTSDIELALAEHSDLGAWVLDKVKTWRRSQEADYFEKWDEYYRIFRGIWAGEDKTRESERSKLIAPATQQAVESAVAEVEEATFGRGSFFDIEDDVADTEKLDTEALKVKLAEEFKKNQVRREVAEVLLNAAIYGTGIGELVVENYVDYAPAKRPLDNGAYMVGRNEQEKMCVKLRPIKPHNFRIPQSAVDPNSCLGVAIEEFVPLSYVEEMQEKGVYRDTGYLGTHAPDDTLEANPELSDSQEERVLLVRYYGKVPRWMLEEAPDFEPSENFFNDDSSMVEAVVVIANDGIILKAEASPYLMNDRPVVAFQWDINPGVFWGRGVCEKGYNPQKALDAELRSRRDAMALNVAPMLGIDATRLPSLGQKLEIRPGKQVLTTGDPREVLHPFRFGDVPNTSFAETDGLSKMVQMATGAVDSVGIAGQVNGEATAAGISMSLGAIIKRHKRTLINFQESFLIPFVQKAGWRYMQFDPDNFPIDDYNFVVTSSLGIVAREYEITQLVQLLQTVQPNNPLYATLIESVIDNMSLSNREQMLERLRQAQQPNPEQQQALQRQREREEEVHQAQLAVLQAQADESKARAFKYRAEGKVVPIREQIRLVDAATETNNDAADDAKEVLDAALKVGQLRKLFEDNGTQ